MIKVVLRKNKIHVSAKYDISEVAELGARRALDGWVMPNYIWALQSLRRLFGDKELVVSKSLAANFRTPFGFQIDPLIEDRILDAVPFSAWDKLHEYQKDLVTYLTETPHPGALVNMDPGLGKTYSSIVAAAISSRKILVVAPLAFLDGWEDEILDAFPDDYVFKSHQKYPQVPSKSDKRVWVIANYNTVVEHSEWFIDDILWDTMIVDESVGVKNRKTARVQNLKVVRKHVRDVWLLSGSPITKFADDLWAQFHLIDPSAFSAYWRFANTYCKVGKTPWGDKVKGNIKSIDLRKEFKDIMFTVKEHEVLDVNPPIYEIIQAPLPPMQKALFTQMKKEFIAEIKQGELKANSALGKLARLQQIVSNPRNIDPEWQECPAKITSLQELFAKNVKLPAIIWTWFIESGKEIENLLSPKYKIARIAGDDSQSRGTLVKSFQQGDIDVLVLSLGVGKYGLTLSKANSMIYYDRTFDADAYIQSLARVGSGLRGQQRTEPYTVYIIHSPNTTDELIQRNLTKKAFSIAHASSMEISSLLEGLSDE